MKIFLNKLKQVSIGASPIVLIILAVHFFIKPMSSTLFIAFIISAVILVVGQALFLVGVDNSILTMGELVGANIRKLKKLPLVLIFGLLFGTMATVAEPAVSVLAGNVNKVNSSIDPTLLTWIVSSGIGIFIAYGLLRIYKQFSIKWSFFISYLVTFVLIFLTPNEFRAIAFDFSGATTGVITVPFILALGVGVTSVLSRKNKDDSYGLIGLASIGPIITMCIMGIIFGGGSGGSYTAQASPDFLGSLWSSFQNILIALVPITVVFFIFNFAFIKLPAKKIGRVLFGLVVTIVGLTLFLTAVNYGFASAGRHIGEAFADPTRASWFKYLLIPFGLLLGFAITYTEVAIRVLAGQIEQNTNGQIKKGTLIFTLALGLALTVSFGMMRILFKIDILWFIIPIFAIGLLCMTKISNMFVGIAFDSGGVASGTITAAFLVPVAIGASYILGDRPAMIYGFGMIALIAAIPMVAIGILGLIYNYKLKKNSAAIQPVVIEPKVYKNHLIGIISNPNNENEISEELKKLGAKVMNTFNAKGMSHSMFNLANEEKILMVALISRDSGGKMLTVLEEQFNFKNHNTGVAFTIPIEKVEI